MNELRQLDANLGHCEFQSIRGDDGLWRAHCKTCPWIGEPQPHPLDCGEDSIRHSKETA
jgi:hypothetical protein